MMLHLRAILRAWPLFVICLLAGTAFGTTFYVDATGGSDSNNGLSPATAWRTVQRVNAYGFLDGDAALFKRGEVWREELSNDTARQGVLHGAYGTGPRPAIYGSAAYPAAQFSPVGGTVYRVAFADPNGVLAGLASTGDHGVWYVNGGAVQSLARDSDATPEPGEWSYSGGWVYINLGTALSGGAFEVCTRPKCVEVWTSTDFDSLSFRYALDGNFNLGCSDFTFSNCEFAYNAEDGIDTGCNGSVGPGMFLRCHIHHNGEHGANHHYNSVTGKTFWDYCLIHDNRGDGIHEYTANNVESWANWVTNSTLYRNGGWGVYVLNEPGRTEFFKTYNSISVGNGAGDFFANNGGLVQLYAGYNCAGPAGVYGGAWLDAGAQVGDVYVEPGFVAGSAAAPQTITDPRLASGAPCIDAGMSLGTATDFDGNSVPYGAATDIGAFEYQGGGPAATPTDTFTPTPTPTVTNPPTHTWTPTPIPGGGDWQVLWSAVGQTGADPSSNYLFDRNLRTWIRGGEISGPATTVRLALRGPGGGSGTTIDHTTIGPRDSDADFATLPTTVTFGGSVSVFLPVGETVVSDPLALDWLLAQDYLVALYLEGGEYITQWTGVGESNAWGRAIGEDQAGFMQVSGYYPHSSVYFVEAVEGITGDPATPAPSFTPTHTATPTYTATSTYTPTPTSGGSGAWETAWSAALQTGSGQSVNLLAARNYRNVIRGDMISKSCSEVRLVLQSPSALSSTQLGAVVIAAADAGGDVYDYAAPGLAVTFGGSTSVEIAPGTPVTSDPIAMPFAPGQDYVVALFHDEQEMVAQWRGDTPNAYLRPTGVDETGEPDVSGYSGSICLYVLESIEGR